MDNNDTPFHAPVSVAVSLNDLHDAALDGVISPQQAQALWTRWVAAPARLGESTYPMSLPMVGDSTQARRGLWGRALGLLRKRLRAWGFKG